MTVLWILLAVAVAAIVALYQYGFFDSSKNKNILWCFVALRFCTVLTIFILLLLPQFKFSNYETVKPKLLLLADNSNSIKYLEVDNQLSQDLNTLQNNPKLKDKFEITTFSFGDDLNVSDSLTYDESTTDLNRAILKTQELFKNDRKAIIILTDGIQNKGRSYRYTNLDKNSRVYPVIYGDTTRYADLSISRINVNRYSYLNNEFPVEVILTYTGNKPVSTDIKITEGSNTLVRQKLSFDKNKTSEIIKFNLTSSQVGLKSMMATVNALENEKNISNNTKALAVEVIDQQTKVLIHSSTLHPDLGSLKKAIETNQQRSVDIRLDNEVEYADYNLVILYGIDSSFNTRLQKLKDLKKNAWIFLGKRPRLDLFNNSLEVVSIENDMDTDEVQPLINQAYTSFNLDAFNYSDYPPVEAPYGSWNFSTAVDILMYKRISGIETQEPIWFTYENQNLRYAISSFNGLWRWRSQSYLENKSFADFDDLVGAQVQFLADQKTRKRLNVEVNPIYEQNNSINISASLLDKNYEFDRDGILNFKVSNRMSDSVFTRPFVLVGNKYKLDLSGIAAGAYDYTISIKGENLRQSGSFEVLDYNPETLSKSASKKQFEELLGRDNVFYQNQLNKLIDQLSKDDIARPLEREQFSFLGLIDFKYLLGLLFVFLGLEWLLRKYNGLI